MIDDAKLSSAGLSINLSIGTMGPHDLNTILLCESPVSGRIGPEYPQPVKVGQSVLVINGVNCPILFAATVSGLRDSRSGKSFITMPNAVDLASCATKSKARWLVPSKYLDPRAQKALHDGRLIVVVALGTWDTATYDAVYKVATVP